MKIRKRILIISLTLLAGFTCSAGAVTKGMKKVIDDALDFSVKQSMSMFNEMKDQKGILTRLHANLLGGQVAFIRVPFGIVTNIVMTRK